MICSHVAYDIPHIICAYRMMLDALVVVVVCAYYYYYIICAYYYYYSIRMLLDAHLDMLAYGK